MQNSKFQNIATTSSHTITIKCFMRKLNKIYQNSDYKSNKNVMVTIHLIFLPFTQSTKYRCKIPNMVYILLKWLQ